MAYTGLVTYVGYFLSLWNEILKYLFVFGDSSLIHWTRTAPYSGGPTGQWSLDGTNLPVLTNKGADIVAAIMTMAHNGLVALAQLSTLLPANALNP